MSEPAPESFPTHRPTGDFDRRVTAVLEMVLCSSIPTQFAIGALLHVAGMQSTDAAGHLSLTYVLTLSLVDTAVLIGLMIVLMRTHGETARATWFAPAHGLRDALFGLATVPLLFFGVGILLN